MIPQIYFLIFFYMNDSLIEFFFFLSFQNIVLVLVFCFCFCFYKSIFFLKANFLRHGHKQTISLNNLLPCKEKVLKSANPIVIIINPKSKTIMYLRNKETDQYIAASQLQIPILNVQTRTSLVLSTNCLCTSIALVLS